MSDTSKVLTHNKHKIETGNNIQNSWKQTLYLEEEKLFSRLVSLLPLVPHVLPYSPQVVLEMKACHCHSQEIIICMEISAELHTG